MKETAGGTSWFKRLKLWFMGLSSRVGVVILICCVLFYALSFVSFALPIALETQLILWTVFFGLAKTAQYVSLLILGKEGIRKIRDWFKRKKGA